ncbi:MAG: hypothetical protein MJ158_02505 [Alphaproteobacteria bacterium]|nr:hypothetical protein [Alphaproteobacteria bacterium]
MRIISYDKISTLFHNLRQKAADIAFANCIKDNGGATFCKCLRADLKEYMSEDNAYKIIYGGAEDFSTYMLIVGARMRCMCRIDLEFVKSKGMSCDDVKPLKF